MKHTVILWPLIIVGMVIIWGLEAAHADMTWNTPVGTIGLPFQASEALVGYDAVLKESIAGISLPVYTDPKGIVALQIGAVAPWQTNGPTIQPYVALGHDILRDIPVLADYKSLHANIFGRYATDKGKAGVGVSFSYSFAGGSLVK